MARRNKSPTRVLSTQPPGRSLFAVVDPGRHERPFLRAGMEGHELTTVEMQAPAVSNSREHPRWKHVLLVAIAVFVSTLVPWRWSGIELRNGNFQVFGLGRQSAIGDEVMATNGLTIVQSNFGVKETMDRLEVEVKAKGLTVFARIDHASGAAEVGMQLRPTELLIFGNARGGTPLMQANQTVGIDLPLKALVYEAAAGKIWLAYNNPSWIAQRHELGTKASAVVQALTNALEALVANAVKAQ